MNELTGKVALVTGGGRALVMQADNADPGAVTAAVEQTVRYGGGYRRDRGPPGRRRRPLHNGGQRSRSTGDSLPELAESVSPEHN
jgi:hypothetical protein